MAKGKAGSGTLTKIITIPIKRPIGYSWNEFRTILQEVQSMSTKAYNMAASEYYVHFTNCHKWQIEHGKFPKGSEVPEPNVYKILRKKYPALASVIAATAQYDVGRKVKKEYKEIVMNNKKSLPTYRNTNPIPIPKQNWYDAWMKRKRYKVISFPLFSKEVNSTKTWLDLPKNKKGNIDTSFSVRLDIEKLNPAQLAIFKNMRSGKYECGQIQLILRKNKWHINFTYTPPKVNYKLDENKIMGIDVGIVYAATCAFSDHPDRLYIPGEQAVDFRKNIWIRRNKYQKSLHRGGKGRKYYLRGMEKLSKSERNYRSTFYHNVSRKIIDFAVKHNVGIIQMEDLTSLKQIKGKGPIRNWALHDLEQKLLYKAEEFGIKIVKVNPKYTSQRCSACGYIHKNNRIAQAEFVCVKCGYAENADYNAARNLSVKDIDKIISANLSQA